VLSEGFCYHLPQFSHLPDLVVDVITFLLDVADQLVSAPSRLRFRKDASMRQIDQETLETSTAVSQSDSSIQCDESTNCLLVRNDLGHTPLLLAIYSRSGWEVIESLVCQDGESYGLDSENNSALHLLVSEHYKDPSAALAVLRAIPEAASIRNDMGMLPIEVRVWNCLSMRC
jgi:ankyrin repeat protein